MFRVHYLENFISFVLQLITMTKLTEAQKVQIKRYVLEVVDSKGMITTSDLYNEIPGLDSKAVIMYLGHNLHKWGLQNRTYGERGKVGMRIARSFS